MKKHHWLILLLLLPQMAFGAAGIADVAGEDSGLFLFMVALMLSFIGMVVFGTLIFAVLIAIALLMTAMGIFSVSVLTCWYHRSFSKGISVFFQLSLITVGCLIGVCLLFLLNICQLSWASSSSFSILVIGTGAIAGWVCSRIIKKLAKLFIEKFIKGGTDARR